MAKLTLKKRLAADPALRALRENAIQAIKDERAARAADPAYAKWAEQQDRIDCLPGNAIIPTSEGA
jgi:hypothetical protein